MFFDVRKFIIMTVPSDHSPPNDSFISGARESRGPDVSRG
jgi:hypothetical protein